jgi:EAL domain-containing protein (putative c-di-GMP-specific phosphodiesterase class I)
MGIGLSIDDFGTGYSSLSYLKRFPFTSLKIDRSFVNDVTDNPDDAALAKAIINMAHSLGLHVIGEGVEKGEQLDFLLAEGCDLVQGFHFSRPMSADQCGRFLRATSMGIAGQGQLSAASDDQLSGSRSSLAAIPSSPGPAAG